MQTVLPSQQTRPAALSEATARRPARSTGTHASTSTARRLEIAAHKLGDASEDESYPLGWVGALP